jgi:hypothetical protein
MTNVPYGLLWHIDNFEESFLLTSKNSLLIQLAEELIELHIQRYPFIHTIHSKQKSLFLDSVKRQKDMNIKDNNDGKYDDHSNDSDKSIKNDINDNINQINNFDSNDTNKNNNFKPYNNNSEYDKSSIWENYSLETAVDNVKGTRPGASILKHVQYKIIPVLTKNKIDDLFPISTMKNNDEKNKTYDTSSINDNKNYNNDDCDNNNDYSHDRDNNDNTDNMSYSFIPTTSASSSSIHPYNSEAFAIFSSKKLRNLKILYNISWPFSSIISPTLLDVTGMFWLFIVGLCCSVISVSFIICMLTLLLMALAGLHFRVGLDFVKPSRCNLF